jgi:dTDP-4-dehydrorhamnose 3,5-epimerase
MSSEFKILSSSKIEDLKVIELPVFEDHRGVYLRTFSHKDYELVDRGKKRLQFVEDDISRSKKGVLRGLHGDAKTWKLIQNLVGEIFFAVVDMRKDSKTYLNVETFTLGDKNRSQVLVPAGCANGHLVLSEFCIFSYKQTEEYISAETQFTVAWNDPKLKIPWPIQNPTLSTRDGSARFLGD